MGWTLAASTLGGGLELLDPIAAGGEGGDDDDLDVCLQMSAPVMDRACLSAQNENIMGENESREACSIHDILVLR